MSLKNEGEVEKRFSSGDALSDSPRLSPHVQCILQAVRIALLDESQTETNMERLGTAEKILREDRYYDNHIQVNNLLEAAGINMDEFHADA